MFFKILAFAFAVETGFLSGGVWNYSDRNVGWVDVGALYTTMEARVEAGAENLFTAGDPGAAVPPTVVTADWLNDVQEEIAGPVERAGKTLVKGYDLTHTQLTKVVQYTSRLPTERTGMLM